MYMIRRCPDFESTGVEMARACAILLPATRMLPTTLSMANSTARIASVLLKAPRAPSQGSVSVQYSSVRRFAASTAVEPLPGRPYSEITIGVPAEVLKGEKRVAQTPETVAQLVKKGYKVAVQSGAGSGSSRKTLHAQTSSLSHLRRHFCRRKLH